MSIIPLAYTFYLSFQNYSLLKPANATFAGIKNYIEIFANQTIRSTVFTTFRYTIWTVVLSTLCGVILAVVVNNIRRGKTFFRIVFFVPMMLSGVVVGVLWRFLFKLAFNQYDIGASSALSVLMFVLLMAVSIVILRNTMKEDKR